jgi:hypothetical protein
MPVTLVKSGWKSGNLVFEQDGSTSSAVHYGVDDTGLDVKMFGATSGRYWLWDESADKMIVIGTIDVGVDNTGHDVKFFGATASAYMLWDESADNLILAGTAGFSVTSPTGSGIGYGTGAGGAVTQATDRTTGVTLNKLTGTITTNNASLAAEGTADFTVTNSTVAIGDTVIVSIQSGSDGGGTIVSVSTVAAGSFVIRVYNGNVAAGTAETGAILINFAVIKAVSA